MAFELPITGSLFVSIFLLQFCAAIDTITPTQYIRDGETLTSAAGNFELGFFSPGNTSNRYVGIWYKIPEKTVVWVANRENPVRSSNGVLTIDNDGNLVILDGKLKALWSTNVSNLAKNASVRLLASGNLILRNGESETLWQSFDHPTHAMLSGMKLGLNRRNGANWSLTSWKSPSDPAPGKFSFKLDPQGLPQFFISEGSDRKWRSGPWNGQRLSGVPDMNLNFIFSFHYVSTEDEVYFTYKLKNESLVTMMALDESGILKRVTWFGANRRWKQFWSAMQDQCDNYAACGAYGSCSSNLSPMCKCLQGFDPKSPQEWYLRDNSDGCVRRKALECGNGDGFLRLEHVKLPDTHSALMDARLSLKECEKACLKNCSCTGYSSADINGQGSGCVIWAGDLIDLKLYADGGQEIYVRVAASELNANSIGHSKSLFHRKWMLALTVILVSLVLFLVCWCCYRWRKTRGKVPHKMEFGHEIFAGAYELENSRKGTELPLFDLSIIATATDNFSDAKKLGEGGFGPVYRGKLFNEREIAVKRLSKNSGQGVEEFRNEVKLISNLQHRNLVRILGYCIQGEEKMLVYEYMPNKSLDSYIFDKTRKMQLDWGKRFNIILGIARGVLYLHQDSRLRIIHRDLKASNVLLDDKMNPKISDFGMARIFCGDQIQANTSKVVGTYGYMSPEYAMDGLFSVKSDVFSFGVLLLEIISGKRNNYYSDDPSTNLIGAAWDLWKEGRSLEVVDSSMSIYSAENEVLRCIQVGLLCVQESPIDRPSMSTVVFMLGNETAMPTPKQPAFSLRNRFNDPDSSKSGTGSYSANDMTVTIMEAR